MEWILGLLVLVVILLSYIAGLLRHIAEILLAQRDAVDALAEACRPETYSFDESMEEARREEDVFLHQS